MTVNDWLIYAPAPTWMPVVILASVAAERLWELRISNRHTRALLARGGREEGAAHYPAIVAVHTLWLAAQGGWLLTHPPVINGLLLVMFAAVQPVRLWVLRTLGPYWTTRIITLPDAPLVTGGPFRYLKHPNYAVVTAEIALLPLVFGAWPVAVLFSGLNAVVLAVRIRAENKVLAARRSS